MANVKNYGLSGIGSDVQYGKSGGRLIFSGGSFAFVDSDGVTPVTLSGADATLSAEFVTLSQLQSVQAGLDLKESVRVATAAALPANTAAGSGVGKTLTADAVGVLTVDGVATVLGDRILVKDESAGADVDHGIYVVTTEGTAGVAFVLTRATDADGSPSNEVTTGMHTFVSEGTTNGGSGWALITADTITVDTTALQFAQFSGSSTYSANNGVELTGSTFRLNIDSLGDEGGTIAGTDTLALGDGTGGGPDTKATFTKLMNDLNIVNVSDYSAGIEFIANTAADSYSKYTLVASAVAGDEGASVTQNGSTIEFGVDITGLSNSGTAVATTNEIMIYDGTNNTKETFADIITDLDIARVTANGIVARTAAGTYAARTLTASAVGDELGITITNGDGVAGNPTIGVDIAGLTDIGVDVVLGTDYLMVSDTSDTGTNKKVTVQEIIDLANASVSTNTISQGDTSFTATDTGIDGTLTAVADGTTVMTIDDTGGTITSLAVSDLTATRVVFAGTGGELVDDAELTFITGTNTLNAANIDSTGNIGAATIQTDGAGITVTSTGTISTATGNISSTSGNITTGGNISTSGTGTITSAAGITDSTLTVTNGVVFANASGTLLDDAGFTYDAVTDTLTVANLNITNGLGATDTQIQFGNATGDITGDADLTWNSTTNVMSLGNLDVDGTNQTITGNVTNGDISIVPNGTGEVIIGSAGNGVISSDTASSMTIQGDTNLILSSNTGEVQISDNSATVATFNATADANRYFTFTADDSLNPLLIGTGGTEDVDIQFVLGTSQLLLVDSATDYNAELISRDDDAALVNKGYVDSQISSVASQGSIQTRIATVSLTSATTTSIGAALPAGAIIIKVIINVATASDAATTLDLGDGTTADKYMDNTEIDCETTGIYVTDAYFLEGSSITVTATVATPGTVGSANVLVEYRVPTA